MRTFCFALFFCLPLVLVHGQGVTLAINEKDFSQGDTVRAEFRFYEFVGIGAFQFAMRHDTAALEWSWLEFHSDLLGEDDFSWHGKPGYNLLPGEMRCVWTNPHGASVESGAHVFSVRFVAKQAGSLSSAFWLWENHHVLKPYCGTASPLAPVPFSVVYVAESTAADEAGEGVAMYAYPNPTADNLRVFVNLKTPQYIFVNVIDSAGHTTFSRRYAHGGGVESFEVEVPSAGVYFVAVSAGQVVRTETIIKN